MYLRIPILLNFLLNKKEPCLINFSKIKIAIVYNAFFLAVSLLASCSSASVAKKLVWGMEPRLVKDSLQQRNLLEIKSYLHEHKDQQVMQEALLLGQDSLYTAALVFAEQKEWNLYHRAMMVQSYSGSFYGKNIALDYMAKRKMFTETERLNSLNKYLEKESKDRFRLLEAASLSLSQGKVEQAQGFWRNFLALTREQKHTLGMKEAELGLRLALLNRKRLNANRYMRQIVLKFPASKAHVRLQKGLAVRPEWLELLQSSTEGGVLLQSLRWKVSLLQKNFSNTLPVLFASGKRIRGKEQLSGVLRFWWGQNMLVADSGRAIFAANAYRSQNQNVENGRKRLKSLLDGQTSLDFGPKTHNTLAYWYIRNNRNYLDMEKYRPQFQSDVSLRSWLLVEYLYFFKNANHWASLPKFLSSWYQELPDGLELNRSSRSLFQGIYRDMFERKRTTILKQMYQVALKWGDEELILDSAWYYRLAKGSPLDKTEWLQLPVGLRSRVLADIRLFVLRADQGEDLLPTLRNHEAQSLLNKDQESLDSLMSSLVNNGFNNEALRLARRYHKELSPSSIVNFSRKIQLQGYYDVSMRMAAQLTYDDNYNMSREAFELLYPKAFLPLMSSFTEEHDLPLPVFYGLVRQESYFAPAVVSIAGAVGLSQLMPATMDEVAQKIGNPDPDATDPETNLKIGSYYLRYLINHRWTNNLAQALMAYNAGLGNMRKWKARLAPHDGLVFNNFIPIRETRLYVQKISAAAIYYAELYDWGSPLFVLQDIYPEDFPKSNRIARS